MIEIKDFELDTMLPLTGNIGEIKIGGVKVKKLLEQLLETLDGEVFCHVNFFPDGELLNYCKNKNCKIFNDEGQLLLSVCHNDDAFETLQFAPPSLLILYPWQLLFLLEKVIGSLKNDNIQGIIKPGVFHEGVLEVGEGTVLLPGVYIEGNVSIGKNCKIGPNCYIRGNTSIGDNCHIGQAVEIKNSLLSDHVSVGHLSYLGDSVIGANVNFGAGTISSNLRHDGKNHRSLVNNHLVDTGRRKFGTIIGANVHTGIHTSIYPGRKIYAGCSTLPGEIVSHDKIID